MPTENSGRRSGVFFTGISAVVGLVLWRRRANAFQSQLMTFLRSCPQITENERCFVRANSIILERRFLREYYRVGFSIVPAREPVRVEEMMSRPIGPVPFAPNGDERFFTYTFATSTCPDIAFREFLLDTKAQLKC